MSIFGSRLRVNSSSVSTRCHSGAKPAPRSARRISSASVGLSSTRRTRSDFLSIYFGRLVQEQPVKSQVSHGGGESLEVHRFDDVAVFPQLVALHDVLLFFRRGEYDNWNTLGARIALDPPQHFDAIDLRQFEIEKDNFRAVLDFASGVRAFAKNKLDRFGAVACDLDSIAEFGFTQGALGQFQILGCIFDDQYLNRIVFVHVLFVSLMVK